MDANEFSQLVEQLRRRIDDVEAMGDEDLSDQMRSARADLRKWDKAGREGPLPHAQQLRVWGIALDDGLEPAAVAAVAAAPPPPEADTAPLEPPANLAAEPEAPPPPADDNDGAAADAEPVEPAPPPAAAPDPDDETAAAAPAAQMATSWDPDDDLQGQFDAAQAMLDNGRYRAARNAFEELSLVASGRLEMRSMHGYDTAAARLADLVRGPIGRAKTHARKQAQDHKGQRQLWQAVLEIDPEDETALAALRALDELELRSDTRRSIDELRGNMKAAVERKNYPGLVELLGRAEALAAANRDLGAQEELDGLVAEARRRRDEVRGELGIASTRAASDDYAGAYRLALEYVDQGVPVAFDEQGIFGPHDTGYDPVVFLKLARENLLRWSRDKALERQRQAAQEAPTAPRRALLTLQEGIAFLENELFSVEDKTALKETLDQINKDIAEVEERLTRFDAAERLVEQARSAQPRAGLRLLREARAVYADYPNLGEFVARAEEGVALVVATELADRLADARHQLDQMEFDTALATIAAARTAAYDEVPHPAPNSRLDQQLRALEALEKEILAAQQANSWDPDDDLQGEFDAAQTYLDNGRYRAALNAFAELRQTASGRLEAPSEQGYETAAARLADQLRGPISRAQNHARKQAQDYKGLRQLWQAVLEIDPQDETALAALRALDELATQSDTRKTIEDIRNRLAQASGRNNYPQLVELLGQAEALAAGNALDSMVPELDKLVQDITRGRDQVRSELGIASTRAASEDYAGAYRLALEYVDQGVPVAFDEQGVFGAPNTEYDPVVFLKLARENLLRWARDKAVERRKTADKEAPTAPRRALLTLQEGVVFLENELFSAEDKAALKETLDQINKDITEVKERITRFETAEKLVNEADLAGPRDRLLLLKQVRATYADFPNLAGLFERAEEAVAAVIAGELQNEMVRARQQQAIAREAQPPAELEADEWTLDKHAEWARTQFKAALDRLAEARERASKDVAYKPESTLDRQLRAVADLEKQIIDDETAYNTLVAKLAQVDKHLRAHETNAPSQVLSVARTELDKLTAAERNHYLALARYSRLADLQDVRESWSQGRDAYMVGNWAEAISLLTRAAGSNIPEHDDAMRMMKRATAARMVEEAREAQGKRNWKDALTKFRLADRTFIEWPTTDAIDPAEPSSRDAKNELQQLAEVEANDELVQTAISKASDWLDKAEILIKARKESGSAAARVEPIDNFAEAVTVIRSVSGKNLRTNKLNELEGARARASRLWRETYIDGIHFALQKDDEELLRRAVALGRVLHVNGLLIEATERDVYRRARERFLDLELARLQGHPPRMADMEAELAELEAQKGDGERIAQLVRDLGLLRQEPIHASALIAQNRKERLQAAEVETDELRNDYYKAVAMRVQHQLVLEKRKGPGAALDFLSRELETRELYQNEDLFAELMHLCWQTRNWSQAADRARSLSSRTRLEHAGLKSELWQGLTAMAAYLDRGERTRFDAELATTRAHADRQPELLAFVERERRWLITWRINTLVTEAEEIAQSGKDRTGLRAIERYAEAYSWAPEDKRIAAGLQTIGAPLIHNLTARIQAAQQMTLQGSLKAGVERAGTELAILQMISTVAQPLGLESGDPQVLQDLAAAIEKLGARLGPWKKVLSKVESAEQKRDEALRQPRSFQADEDGGWQFDEARRLLEEAQREARGDRELTRNIQDVSDDLDGLQSRADGLNDLINDFRQASLDERFDDAIEAAQLLIDLWPKRRDSDNFTGLDSLIKVSYPQVKKQPKGLGEHITLARDQKRNLQEWTEWAERAKRAYDEARRAGEELRADLQVLRMRKSLAILQNECERVIKLSGAFANELATAPQDEPKSTAALTAQKRITQTMIAEVGNSLSGYHGRAKTLGKEVEKELNNLTSGPLPKLRSAIDRLEREAQKVGKRPGLFKPPVEFIPNSFFETAEQYLADCEKIDPNNSDLQRLNDKLNTYNDKRKPTSRK